MPQDSRFLALLRGINVGGHNVISKGELAGCFEDLGFESVRTYIQSGNILFRAAEADVEALTETIEVGLSERFSYDAKAVVLSHKQYESIISAAPAGWGADDRQKHNALFTVGGVTPEDIIAQLPDPAPEIEVVTAGPGVVFWSISKAEQTRTTWAKLPAARAYRQVTIRNHKTVFKLRELFGAI